MTVEEIWPKRGAGAFGCGYRPRMRVLRAVWVRVRIRVNVREG